MYKTAVKVALVFLGLAVGTSFAYVTISDECWADATYPNQGRHIVRDPTNGTLHVCWGYGGELMYSYSTDVGDNWSSPEIVYTGGEVILYPCVAVDKNHRPWIFGTYTYTNMSGFRFGWLWGFRRNGPNDWEEVVRECWDWHSIGPASVVVSNGSSPDDVEPGGVGPGPGIPDAPMAYVVVPYQQYDISNPTGQHWLWFYAIDEQGIRYQCEIDYINASAQPDHMRASIDYLPGDDIHVVYQKGLPRMYHQTACAPGGPGYFRHGGTLAWTDPVRISNEFSEPASLPSLNADGDRLTACWQGPGYLGDQEAWKAQRNLWLPWWDPPAILSTDDEFKADYPSAASRLVASYQEATELQSPWNEEVIVDCWGPWNASRTPDHRSRYPHTYAVTTAPPDPLVIHTYTVWTENTSQGSDEVVFQYRKLIPMDGGPGDRPCYLTVNTGEPEPSVYCLERTGYRVHRNHSVDYGNERLRYRLPYLNPQCEYVLEVDAYHEQPGPVAYEFWADGISMRRVLVEPSVLKTVYLRLPGETYARDFVAEIEVRSPTLDPVALADGFKAYQTLGGRGRGGGQSLPKQLPETRPPVSCRPNPVVDRVSIRYTLPKSAMIRIWISDVSGRKVRELLNYCEDAGEHSTTWDCKDSSGMSIPNGIYFLNLRTGQHTVTRQLVVTR